MKKSKHIFEIVHDSEVDDQVYSGTFSCRKLSIKDYAELSVRKAKLNGGLYYDENKPGCGIDLVTDNLNHMFAHLDLALISAPSWWNLKEIGDLQLITKVFTEVNTFENSFRNRRESAGGSEGGSETSVQEAHARRNTSSLVGKEVQDPLDP
jgi:hypothetical protein